jgi:hypothetical protein
MSDDLLERMTEALREEGGAQPSRDRSELVRARVLAQTKRRAQLRPQGMWQWAAVVCLGFFVSTAMAHVIRVQLPRVLEVLRPQPEAPPTAAAKRPRLAKPQVVSPVQAPAVEAPPVALEPEPEVAPIAAPVAVEEQPAPVARVVKQPAAARERPVASRAPHPSVRVPVAAPPPVEERVVVREVALDIEPARPNEPPPSAAPTKVPAAESGELALFRRAQALHLTHDARAIEAWDAYLRVAPTSALAPEARYNRALGLVRARRFADAKRALAPFAEGKYGAYRRPEAQALLGRLPE